jgi:YebC/PmpR family DNA-binding regulatory protein
MGRIYETRKATMFKRFAKMSKAFNRIGREIEIAVKSGVTDPKLNPRLRLAIQNAKSVNMPKERIEAAINRAAAKDTAGYLEVLYEGYGPHGIAMMVECATDNPTRSVANIRMIFSRNGGSLASTGSIAFMFERKGIFKVAAEHIPNLDDFELEMIDHGLEEMEKQDHDVFIYTSFQDFGKMHKALEEKGIKAINTELQYIPTTTKALSEAEAKEVQILIDALEEDDDVQSVFNTMA